MSNLGLGIGGFASGLASGIATSENMKRQQALANAYMKHQAFTEGLAREQAYMKPYEETLGKVPGASGDIMQAMETERQYRANPQGFQYKGITAPGQQNFVNQPDSMTGQIPPSNPTREPMQGSQAYGSFLDEYGQKVRDAQMRQLMMNPMMAYLRAQQTAAGRQSVTGDPFEHSRQTAMGADAGHLAYGPRLAGERARETAMGGMRLVPMVNDDGTISFQTQAGVTINPQPAQQSQGWKPSLGLPGQPTMPIQPGGITTNPTTGRPAVTKPMDHQTAQDIKQLLEFYDFAVSLKGIMDRGEMPSGGRVRTGLSDLSGELGAMVGSDKPVLWSNPELDTARKWLMTEMMPRARAMGGVRMAGSPQMFEKFDVKNFPNLERMATPTLQNIANMTMSEAERVLANARAELQARGYSTDILDKRIPHILGTDEILGRKALQGTTKVTLPGQETQDIDEVEKAIRGGAYGGKRTK